MYRSVRDLGTRPNVALIGTIAALNDGFTAHTASISMIESLDLARAGFAAGGAAAKTLARTQLELTLSEVDGIVTAFAAATSAADLRLDLIMDKLMRQFRETQPALYLTYKESRVINDAAAGVGSGGSRGGGGGSPLVGPALRGGGFCGPE